MSDDWGPWIGASGTEYNFIVYGRDEVVPSRQGLFIYCRKDAQGLWAPIYMGHGDLAVCCADPGLLACIASKGMTHLHMRLSRAGEDPEAEIADLLARYRNAYAPWGCNVAGPSTAGVAAVGAAPPPAGPLSLERA